MSFYTNSQKNSTAFAETLRSFQLEHSSFLDSKTIRAAFANADCVFAQKENTDLSMTVVFWAFLSEMLHTGKERSLSAAVERIRALQVIQSLPVCSANTGAYSIARAKIKTEVPMSLMQHVAMEVEKSVPDTMLWHGLHYSHLDGSTGSFCDTAANQSQFPQMASQLPGLGFPIMRYVLLTSGVTGMAQSIKYAPYAGKATGEMSLLREMYDDLKKNSPWINLIVADKYYCSYFTIAALASFGIDFIGRLHQSRDIDKAFVEEIGNNGDYLVRWIKPRRPEWMDQKTYDAMPGTLTTRTMFFDIDTPGSRVDEITVVTTLLDTEMYPCDEIGEMFRSRWNIETDLRVIKTFMRMDILRAKTPELALTEFGMGLLAYNLVRTKMYETALRAEEFKPRDTTPEQKPGGNDTARKTKTQKIDFVMPRHLSFAQALCGVTTGYVLLHSLDEDKREQYLEMGHESRIAIFVGNRSGRFEPRVVKRRPDVIRLMTKPRTELKQELLDGTSEEQRE